MLGSKSTPDIPAFKYARRMEPLAVTKYTEIQRRHGAKITSCGLFVDATSPYIGASPDRLVSCCCGDYVLEVKCPVSISNQVPSESNLPYLCDNDGVTILKRNHQYHFQIQSQMALTERIWGIFFIYTHKGYYLERVVFHEEFWKRIVQKLTRFWMTFVYPNYKQLYHMLLLRLK